MIRATLKQAMQNLRIEIVEGGYALHNAAGIAFYDHWGIRGEVRGIPEFFPTCISVRGLNEDHSPMTLADCKKRFGDDQPLHFGGFPMPKRKVRINISGLHELKDGNLSGAEVEVGIWQKNKRIHCEVFSGKATQPFTREVEVLASLGEIVVVHNRPDLKELKVSAEFTDVTSNKDSAESLHKIISEQVRQRLNKELQPGGLLHKR
ncbi:hypothetical protein [Pantoea septica]|uniref:hypothetical protein n=1 Tax=Pantoea septica TaxID=472695 RepID=UPI0028A053F8|nr:hypothetical protein [Pantoea septica]